MATWSVDGQAAFATADVVSQAGYVRTGAHQRAVGGDGRRAGRDGREHHRRGGLPDRPPRVGRTRAGGRGQRRHRGSGRRRPRPGAAAWASTAPARSTRPRCGRRRGATPARTRSPWTKPPKARPGSPVRVSGHGALGRRVRRTRDRGELRRRRRHRDGDAPAPTAQAGATLTAPLTAGAAIIATATTTGLTYFASDPGAVAPGAPLEYSGTGTFAASLAPKPVISVGASSPLVMASGQTTPIAHVSGTYGYSGDGLLTLAGPSARRRARACSALTGGDFDHATPLWTGAFNFTGDGAQQAGAVTDLHPAATPSARPPRPRQQPAGQGVVGAQRPRGDRVDDPAHPVERPGRSRRSASWPRRSPPPRPARRTSPPPSRRTVR